VESSGTWQSDVIDALAWEPTKRVSLMRAATVWAVPSSSWWGRFYLVLAASQEAQTLKVCSLPLRGSLDSHLEAEVSRHLFNLGPTTCLYIDAGISVSALPDPSFDEGNFLYDIEGIGMAKPCQGYRFRDHCRHVDATPLETITREP
jgi:hypothetical protein